MVSSELLRVEGAEQLRKLSRDLRKQEDGKEIRQGLVRELKAVADEIVQAEKRAVLALPSKGENARRRRRSLRRRMASATTSQVRTAAKDPRVNVLVNPTRLPPSMANLPAYMNAEPGFTNWRVRNFGRDDFHTQAPMPWFYRTAQPFEQQAQRRLIGVLDQVADQTERGT